MEKPSKKSFIPLFGLFIILYEVNSEKIKFRPDDHMFHYAVALTLQVICWTLAVLVFVVGIMSFA